MRKGSQPVHDVAIDKDIGMRLRDGIGSAPYTHSSADYNAGRNTLYTDGAMASHLLLPVIPSS